MTQDEIKDIQDNMHQILDHLAELDSVEDWTSEQAEEAAGDVADLRHYMTRLESYYQMYRSIE